MERIILTATEYQWALRYIEDRKKGLIIDYYPKSPKDPCKTVLDKALKLEEETGGVEERIKGPLGGDIVYWFIREYQKQEGLPMME